MSIVLKQTIPIVPDNINKVISVQFPKNSRLLSTHNQGGKLVVWAVAPDVSPQTSEELNYSICVMTTGSRVEMTPENWKFLGTVLMDDGAFVLHVFSEQ